MAKRLHDYIKYTKKELDSYTKTEGSCVYKINKDLHMSLGPYCLSDFKHALIGHITRRKVGYYDMSLNGIILDIKNIKVLGTSGALRADDPRIHVDLNADCYVFRPVAGAVLNGIVKHVGNHQVGVIIYRVFNVNIRLEAKINPDDVQIDSTVEFRIKNFNLQNVFPYIEGELIMETSTSRKRAESGIKSEKETNSETVDSGIEERECLEMDDLLTLIKEEPTSEVEHTPQKRKEDKSKGKSSKKKRKLNESTEIAADAETDIITEVGELKKEPKEEETEEDSFRVPKRRKKHSQSLDNSAVNAETTIVKKEKSKKRRSKNSESSVNEVL